MNTLPCSAASLPAMPSAPVFGAIRGLRPRRRRSSGHDDVMAMTMAAVTDIAAATSIAFDDLNEINRSIRTPAKSVSLGVPPLSPPPPTPTILDAALAVSADALFGILGQGEGMSLEFDLLDDDESVY